MKGQLPVLSFCLAMIALVRAAPAQNPVITSFSQNGVLVCSNLQVGTVAAVEWASSVSGPWQTNWASLNAVMVASDGTIAVSVPMFYRVRGVAAPTNMALIAAGSFTMGNSSGDPDVTDAATVTANLSSFYMDKNLVSFSQWQATYSYATNHGYGFANAGAGKAANHPVQTVNWWDVVKWCNARSQEEGLTPVYYTDPGMTQVFTNGEATPCANWTASGYRLPTEAEWEKAARGGLSGQRFPWGNTISQSQANYYGDTFDYSYDLAPNGYNPTYATGGYPYTSPVGVFGANGYGLYDMAGNVLEWCWDWYGTPYSGGSDPRGPASGTARVIRGGDWGLNASYARCAVRDRFNPSTAAYSFCFRCVRGL